MERIDGVEITDLASKRIENCEFDVCTKYFQCDITINYKHSFIFQSQVDLSLH